MINKTFEHGLQVVANIQATQYTNIDASAKLIADAFLQGNKFFVSGSGHSHTVAEEFYGRAGGLAFTIPIMTTELTLQEHPTKSSYIERLPGYAKILTELYNVNEHDVVLIASNSGRNAYPIELALESKKRGAKVIAITNIKHSTSCTSRHESNLMLMDIADVVIDTCGDIGDASLHVTGCAIPMAPTSSMANAFIVASISTQCATYIIEGGVQPPVFISLNVDGNEDVNDTYFKQYTRQY